MKKTIHRLLFAAIVPALIILSSCSSTQLVGEWKSADYSGPGFKKFVILAMFKEASLRQTYENEFVRIFKRDGNVDAVSSLSMLDPDKEYKQDEMEKIFNDNQIDAIIIINLKDKETGTTYVPGSYNYTPAPYFGFYYTAYFNFYSGFYSPGYTVQTTTYIIDINLYGNSDDKHLWQGETKSIDPASVNTMADEIASITLQKLFSDAYILKSK